MYMKVPYINNNKLLLKIEMSQALQIWASKARDSVGMMSDNTYVQSSLPFISLGIQKSFTEFTLNRL